MSRAATSRLKVNAPLGSPPTLEWRAVGELLIDPVYQRSIDTGPSQSLIRKIAMFWDWGLCQPLTVSRRPDGALTIVDGQHRASAAKLRGDIPHLPCVITSYTNAGDEAAAFVALNQMRRPLSALDLFKAAVAAEDAEALVILGCLKRAGLSIAPHTNYTAWKPGMVANIGALQRFYRRFGEIGERVLETSLIALATAYPGQILQYAGTLFPGLAVVVADEIRLRSSREETLVELIQLTATKSQSEWRSLIKASVGESGGMAREASEMVFRDLWRKRHNAPATLPVNPPLANRAPVILDPGEIGWCSQCDKKVSGERAARCTDRFCKMRKAKIAEPAPPIRSSRFSARPKPRRPTAARPAHSAGIRSAQLRLRGIDVSRDDPAPDDYRAFLDAVHYCREAEAAKAIPSLFDLIDAEAA